MTDQQPCALIVEINHYHGHVVYPQCMLLLDAGYDVTLFVSDRQMDRDLIFALDDQITIIEIDHTRRKRHLLQLWWQAARGGYDFVIFNTLDSAFQLGWALALPGNMRYVLHNLKRNPPFSALAEQLHRLAQRKASRIFVLSEHVQHHAPETLPPDTTAKLSYFHPSFFGDFAAGCDRPPATDGRIVFGIPGAMDGRRRNYDSLINSLPRLADSPLRDRIEIHIMGNFLWPAGRRLVVEAGHHGLVGNVILFQEEQFLSFHTYSERLKAIHFVLPLLDSSVMEGAYNQYTVPSSLMLSRAFAVPILHSDDFTLDADLQDFALDYPGTDLFSGLEKAVQAVDSGRYPAMKQDYAAHMRACFATSQANYLSDVR